MAIAFDSSAMSASVVSDTMTMSLTNSGNLIVACVSYWGTIGDGNIVTGITYNSVAMTFIGDQESQLDGVSAWVMMYYLLGPATGAHDVVASFIPGHSHQDHALLAASYTGVQQSGQPDSHATPAPASTPITLTTTTVAANCWTVGFVQSFYGQPFTGGTGTTIRQAGTPTDAGLGDSNGALSAGSHSLIFDDGSSGINNHGVIASFAPSTGAAAYKMRRTLTPLGTQVGTRHAQG